MATAQPSSFEWYKTLVAWQPPSASSQRLIGSPGFTRLRNIGRLDLSVEAHVITYPWATLFTRAELEEARRRLREYGYHLLSTDN